MLEYVSIEFTTMRFPVVPDLTLEFAFCDPLTLVPSLVEIFGAFKIRFERLSFHHSSMPALDYRGLTGSPSRAHEPVQERADLMTGTSRPAHESRSKSPKWPFSARYRASSPIQGPSKLDRLTVQGRAHGGLMATSWTGPTFEGRGQSRAGLTAG